MTVIALDRPAAAAPDALPRQFARFVAVGVVNTGLFLAVYLLFRTLLPAVVANVLATWLTTVIGTKVNGKVTFGVQGAIGLGHHVKSLAVTLLGLAITTGAVDMVATDGNAMAELVVLTVASGAAGAVRFALLRVWVFRADDGGCRPVGSRVPRTGVTAWRTGSLSRDRF